MSQFEQQQPNRQDFPQGETEFNRRGEWARRTKDERVSQYEERYHTFMENFRQTNRRYENTIQSLQSRVTPMPEGVGKTFYRDWYNRIVSQGNSCYKIIRYLDNLKTGIYRTPATERLYAELARRNPDAFDRSDRRMMHGAVEWEAIEHLALAERQRVIANLNETLDAFEKSDSVQRLDMSIRSEQYAKTTDEKLAQVDRLASVMDRMGQDDADLLKEYRKAMNEALLAIDRESSLRQFNVDAPEGSDMRRSRYLYEERERIVRKAMENMPGDRAIHGQLKSAVAARWQFELHNDRSEDQENLMNAVDRKTNLFEDMQESYKEKVIQMLEGKTPEDMVAEAQNMSATEIGEYVRLVKAAGRYLVQNDPDWKNKDSYCQKTLIPSFNWLKELQKDRQKRERGQA